MDNAQKAIVVGVALFITIIIVAAVMLITGIGTNLLNKGTDKASNVAAQLDQTELEQYDNTTMSGALVVSAIKKYNTDSNIVVVVKTGTSGTNYKVTSSRKFSESTVNINHQSGTTYYKADKNGTEPISSPSISDFTNMTGSNYISASSQWHAYLLKNASDSTIGIVFEKQT